MRTKLTLLAVLASASLMANAQSTAPAMPNTAAATNVQSIPSGNEPLNKAPTMKTPSDKTRAAVNGEAADAARTGTIATGNQPLTSMESPHSNTTRSIKSSEGAAAIASGKLATGNEPIVGLPNEKAQNQMKKSDMAKTHMSNKKSAKKGSDHAKNMAGGADAVKSGNEPYLKTPTTLSEKTRADVRADTAMNGGAEAAVSGNQPLAPRTTTTSSTSRASVKADAAAAAKNDAIRTGDGAAKAAN